MISQLTQLIKNMGFRYVLYRAWYEFKRKSGLLTLAFPTSVQPVTVISAAEWRRNAPPLFSPSQTDRFPIGNNEKVELIANVKDIQKGVVTFFSGRTINLGADYDWVTNPLNGFKYDPECHWTKIHDLSADQGDIKWVWEKSRFCFVEKFIRNDFYNGTDSSKELFTEILSWIAHNPLNCGPNYKCSQEIAIRVLNWIIALNYYKDSKLLDTPVNMLYSKKSINRALDGSKSLFETVLSSIWHQTDHINKNINFSRFTVRNNHAITESLCLYAVGRVFPWLKKSSEWESKGKRFLTEEGLYQIYSDGSYIQHSMNYQRVVVQLYTYALAIAASTSDQFPEPLKERLLKSVTFLHSLQENSNGMLPHYGHCDGALFFPFNSCNFRDFRPQLNALYTLLTNRALYRHGAWSEDAFWFGARKPETELLACSNGTASFDKGGYYVLRSPMHYAFIRCNKHKHRPFQADNLHCDLWYSGSNIVHDNGTYLYNDKSGLSDFFIVTRAHNTVMVDNAEQMRKGPRFIWFDWSQAIDASVSESEDYYEFKGSISAFKELSKNIIHSRTLRQWKNRPQWEIVDTVTGWSGAIKQIWNLSTEFKTLGFNINSKSADSAPIQGDYHNAWYAPTYGEIENSTQLLFVSDKPYIKTCIMRNEE